MCLSFKIGAGPRQRSHFQVHPAVLMTTFYSLRFETPQTGGPDLRIFFPRNRVDRLYSQTSGSLFVASYDAQSNGGSIDLASTWVSNSNCLRPSLYSLGVDPQKTPLPSNSSIAIEVCLTRCCIQTEFIRLLLALSLPLECVYRAVA
jgi:hypothetical protein